MEIKSLSLNISHDDGIQWDFHFDYNKKKVTFRKMDLENNDGLKESFPSENAITVFVNNLDKIAIYTWEKDSFMPSQYKLQWRVELIYSEATRVIIDGSDGFPEEWSEFCDAVNSIVGDKEFLNGAF